jgi:uncharacterized protein (DUF58 family)
MNASLKDLLKPEIINTMNGLELVARVIVEGFMSGSNKSKSIGAGQEFSQYRNYQAGDDLRQLDWKMFARSERYYIKQSEIETNITVKFMLDASHSMAYVEDGISKLQYGKVISAALAYLARKQGDTFGLYIINNAKSTTLRPRFEQQQFMRLLYSLTEAEAKGEWKKGRDTEEFFDHHGKEMIIFISDLYDDQYDLQQFISRLKTARNEVIVFHILGKRELTLDQEGAFTFEDLETRAVVKVETALQRDAYTKKVQQWIDQTRSFLLEKNVSYHLISMSDPVEDVLRDFLKARKSIA